MTTIVHYVNQFFAGLGGEEAADHEPVRLDGPHGPGRALAVAGLAVDITRLWRRLLRRARARGAGELARLGRGARARCARLRTVLRVGTVRIRVRDLCTRARTARHPGGRRDDPRLAGVLAAEGAAYIVPTGSNVAAMREAVPVIASLASAAWRTGRRAGRRGLPSAGLRVNALVDRTGADRAIDLLLAKLAGDVHTEVSPRGDRVPPHRRSWISHRRGSLS